MQRLQKQWRELPEAGLHKILISAVKKGRRSGATPSYMYYIVLLTPMGEKMLDEF